MARKLLLAIMSLVGMLVALELLVRITGIGVHDVMRDWYQYAVMLEHDDAGGYLRHPASTSVVNQGVTMRFNSLGMRDDEPRTPKPPSVFRVLCLGDSHTAGTGVAQDLIYPARLRAILARESIEVVAAGVGGWNTVAESRFLAQHIDRLEPDLVSLLYVTNDTEPSEAFEATGRPTIGWRSRLYRYLVVHDRLFEWGAWVYRTTFARPDPVEFEHLGWLMKKGTAAFDPEEPGWLESRAALARILGLTRARGARLVIFVNNQMNRPLEKVALQRLSEFGAENAVPVFDTYPFYEGRPPPSLMNKPFRDPHQNAAGHALLAAGIARTLRAGGFLPARASVSLEGDAVDSQQQQAGPGP